MRSPSVPLLPRLTLVAWLFIACSSGKIGDKTGTGGTTGGGGTTGAGGTTGSGGTTGAGGSGFAGAGGTGSGGSGAGGMATGSLLDRLSTSDVTVAAGVKASV